MSTLSAETARPRRGVRGFLARAWQALLRPAARLPVVVLLLLGGAGGILFWGGFNWAMELTNTEAFCVSCHEMRNTVFVEYKETPHYNNPSGVRASCPDCHVPDPWVDKVVRKVKATNELWHKLAGTIGTPADFETHRLQLAQSVWTTMKTTDSRE
jgi:cytochrome c-type protein NapC